MSGHTLNSIITRALETGWAVNAGPWQDSFPDTAPQPRWRVVTFALGDRRMSTTWVQHEGDAARPEYRSGYAWQYPYTLDLTILDTPQSVAQEVSRGGAGA